MPKPFIFPGGIRFPRESEIPESSEKEAILARMKNASIEPGYLLNTSANPGYTHYIEINVSAPDIWDVFADLCEALLPEKISLILGEKGESEHEFFYSPQFPKSTFLTILEPFTEQLANDAHVQFGAIHHDNHITEEIFVHPSKYFTVWTCHEKSFRDIMAKHDIHEAHNLSFIDEFPRVTLGEYPGQRKRYDEVIKVIKSKFPVFLIST